MKSLVPNLHFAGQLTSPGPGVPPSIISGMITADVVDRAAYLRPSAAASQKSIGQFLYGLFAAIADVFAMTTIEMVSGLDFVSALRATVTNLVFVFCATREYLAGSGRNTNSAKKQS